MEKRQVLYRVVIGVLSGVLVAVLVLVNQDWERFDVELVGDERFKVSPGAFRANCRTGHYPEDEPDWVAETPALLQTVNFDSLVVYPDDQWKGFWFYGYGADGLTYGSAASACAFFEVLKSLQTRDGRVVYEKSMDYFNVSVVVAGVPLIMMGLLVLLVWRSEKRSP